MSKLLMVLKDASSVLEDSGVQDYLDTASARRKEQMQSAAGWHEITTP
jgi:hypothetical protein